MANWSISESRVSEEQRQVERSERVHWLKVFVVKVVIQVLQDSDSLELPDDEGVDDSEGVVLRRVLISTASVPVSCCMLAGGEHSSL